MLTGLRRIGGAVPRTVNKLRKREKLFVHIRSKEAWEQDYSQHKWDQLLTKFNDAGNMPVIGFMLSSVAGPRPTRLLDVGCGNGGLLRLLQGLTVSVEYVGADISGESLQQLRANYPAAKTVCTDMADVGKIPGQYQVIIFNECLYYTNYGLIIDRYRSKLEPGGVMIVSMVNNTGRAFIWRGIEKRMDVLMSHTIRNNQSRDAWTVKLLRYK